MIRSFGVGLILALIACVATWFVLPDSTYVEDAFQTLVIVFVLGTISGAILDRIVLAFINRKRA